MKVTLNGRTATADELAVAAVMGYGHFTAMQVREGRTRGLDFHFARLDAATRELFGVGLSGDRVREYVRHALGADKDGDAGTDAGTADASVRVSVFSPGADRTSSPEISVLVSVRPPQTMRSGPWKLRSVPYQRPFAHLKHSGGFAQGRYIDLVAQSGYTEPLLVDRDGTIAEGAITNIGFVSGESVIWPDAPMLHGISMQVVERELAGAGIASLRRRMTLDDVPSFDGVFVTNSHGIAVVGRIDEQDVPVDTPFLGKVLDLYAAAPWDAI